jgi:hypothetical protein
VTQDEIKNLLFYDAETGLFTWKNPPGKRMKKGDLAGSFDGKGYRRIMINRKKYLLHRVAWLYVYGYWPPKLIDHINRVRDDNRITNLRLADAQLNSQNKSQHRNNTSGVRGVSWHKQIKKWQAQLQLKTKNIHVGTYDSFCDAKLAREIAEIFCFKGGLSHE